MGQATVVSLTARPWQSVNLCFEVGGILETLGPYTTYGQLVTPFPFSILYLGKPVPSPTGDLSLLAKSADIWSLLQNPPASPPPASFYLASLRAEPRKAALDMAVNARQNAYYARYSPTASAAIVAAAKCYESATPNTSSQTNNLWMLQQLASLSNTQATQLTTAYNAAPAKATPPRGWPTYPTGSPAVVPYTVSQLKSWTYTTDSSTATPTLTTTTTPSLTTTTTPGELEPSTLVGLTGFLITNPETAVESGRSTDTETGKEASTGTAYALEGETIQNYDYTFRVPYVEAMAQNYRAQISLNDQQFSLTLATQNVPKLGAVLTNELSSIDLAVYQMQIGFINTVLVPTINGTITGIYKYPGDPVRAGEPVIRIDDNSTMFVVARLVYPGPINVGKLSGPPVTGSQVTIATNLFDANAEPVPAVSLTSLNGTVVAVRGAGDDDLWDVVIQCVNPVVAGQPVFPIGYTFDYDNTSVTIT